MRSERNSAERSTLTTARPEEEAPYLSGSATGDPRTMRKLLSILRHVGPHPLRLARTGFFFAERERRRYVLALDRRARPRRRLDLQLRLPLVALTSAQELPEPLQNAARRIRAEAEFVLEHRVDVLGSGLCSLGAEIDWHRDFKSGERWAPAGYRRIRAVRPGTRSDPKVPWELSRGHQLLTLSRAAALFRDECYVAELGRQLDSWLSANPPGIGINWASPLEVALRAVNWIWALATVEPYRPLDGELRKRVAKSLYEHGRQLEANIEGAPYLRDNHFVGVALGLLAIGASLPEAPRSDRWVSYGVRNLERELVLEVGGDGVSREESLPYHGLVLEMFLLGRQIAKQAARPFSPAGDEQLRRMLEVSRALRHPNGRIPLFGDQDSGRVLPAGFARAPTHDNLLWLGAGVLGSNRPLAGDPDPELAWTLGLASWREARDRPPDERAPAESFPEGGLYVLDSKRAHVAVCTGPPRRRGMRAHAHNDALSFELSIDGVPVVVDSGTFVYTADIEARNRFRSSAAHNVTVLDDEETCPIDPQSVFALAAGAGCELESRLDDRARAELIALCSDYLRLRPSAQVRRRFALERGGRLLLTIEDDLLGSGRRRDASYVHLAPGAKVGLAGQIAEIEHDSASFRVSFDGFDELRLLEGEVSDRYGSRRQAPVLVAVVTTTLPARVGYRIEDGASE